MSATLPMTTPATLETARHHHASGQLLPAAQAYRRALESNPQSQTALLGLSLIARQSSQFEPALRMAQAALAAGQNSAVAWANLADTLAALGQVSSSEFAFRRALTLDSTIAAAHYGLGNARALQDNFPLALKSFHTAVQLAPAIPEFHFAEAFAEARLGAHSQAILAYRRAVILRPNFASAWLNLGVELVADGRGQLAGHCYRQALAASQKDAGTRISAHLNLGHLARGRRRFSEAQEHYSRALALTAKSEDLTLSPLFAIRLPEIQIAFTYLHLEQQEFPQAWQFLHLAQATEAAQLRAAPVRSNPEIPNARGILLLAEHSAPAGQFPSPISAPQLSLLQPGFEQKLNEAISAFGEAESKGHKTAGSNRGNALLRLGRCEEALAAHQQALARNPHHPGIRYNLALTELRLGDFANGWPNYEIRWSFREVHPHPRRFLQPRWQGEGLDASAGLFLYAEQGLGDTLQFLRYLPLGVPQLVLEVQPPLTRLLAAHISHLKSTRNVTVELIAHGDPIPPFTHHCPLLSLPAVFQTTLATVPNETPYLHLDPQLTRARAVELSLSPDFPAIGIAWAGNPRYRADHERSTRLETFLPLLEIHNIQWVSLQKGEAAAQIAAIPSHLSILDGCSGDQDFASTAALLANLDLVITTDSAVAHLAGALGKPLWLLLPWQSDWRWMQQTLTTPWYPTARLFRQSSPNNWPELIARVVRELHEYKPGRPAPRI